MKRLFQPAKWPVRLSFVLFIIRVVVGAAFMFHGWSKIQNPLHWMGDKADMPSALQALAAISEFGGGLAWILGLLTPLAAFGIGCTMSVALWVSITAMHAPFVSPKGGPSCELPAVFLCIALLLLLCGPGQLSLDQALFGGSKPAKPPSSP